MLGYDTVTGLRQFQNGAKNGDFRKKRLLLFGSVDEEESSDYSDDNLYWYLCICTAPDIPDQFELSFPDLVL
jgi:hypothetical protein